MYFGKQKISTWGFETKADVIKHSAKIRSEHWPQCHCRQVHCHLSHPCKASWFLDKFSIWGKVRISCKTASLYPERVYPYCGHTCVILQEDRVIIPCAIRRPKVWLCFHLQEDAGSPKAVLGSQMCPVHPSSSQVMYITA